MSQAALNVRHHNQKNDEDPRSGGPSNGAFLGGLFFFLFVVGTIIWSGWMVMTWMKDADRLPMSKLVLTGERHYTKNDDVRKAILALGQPGTFMTVDVNAIQKQISMMPWVRQVTVRKQWPDELKIHIVEYRPFARWNDQNMVDEQGRVFNLPVSENGKGDYVLLYGPQGSQKEVLKEFTVFKNTLAAHNLKLKSLSMTARHAWQIILDNDVRIELGKKDVSERLNRFLELYPLLQQTTDKRVDYVDLRYSSGAAVGWAPLLVDAPPELQ
ncbi:cell division protein FtsQ [Providencia hangzhouensis]|uniref:cell division protein FtsQ n=1 Tax=Providencia TaxID=586 RepID=UPI000D8D798B|nr:MULTISPECIES: cell division protein FtsQ [Providencia]PYZ60208.1 cell division protein FtsQ [Providencia rettgeri]QIF65207.1 cell division protein FtsQ [Providencia sp. 1709051003]WOB96410.1 cell division protein FtsQ [Providencia sp. PROV099]